MAVSTRHRLAGGAFVAVLTAGLALSVSSWCDTMWSVPDSGPPIGHQPPAFELPVVANGSGSLSLEETRGAPLVIEIFASWCKYCDRASETIVAAAGRQRRGNVRFLGVSLDEYPEQAATIATEWRLPYEVVHDDGSLTRAWGISALPTVIVLDAEGRVRFVSDELVESTRLERWLRSVGAGLDLSGV